jgi:hypothetical protein
MSKRNGSTIMLRKPILAYLLLSKEPEMISSYYSSYSHTQCLFSIVLFMTTILNCLQQKLSKKSECTAN